MATLQRLLAVHILAALEKRGSLRVSIGSSDAVIGELEAAIAPLLPSITPYLIAAHDVVAYSEVGFGDRNADEAVAVMIDAVGDRLAHSNHIDDIFADDARIRRDSLRAARELLLRYMAGELEIEDDATHDDTYVVSLDSLGYVVAAAAKRAPERLLRRALGKAARHGRAELLDFDAAAGVALFRPGGDHAGLLAIEETIAREIGRMVEAGLVELPSIEQFLEINPELAASPCLSHALLAAAANIQRRVRCLASCTRISKCEVRVSLTPLTADVAQHAAAHFDELLTALESALHSVVAGAQAPSSRTDRRSSQAPDSEERMVASPRRPQRAKSSPAPTSSQRQPRAKQPHAKRQARKA
jgi:hypothetical protein